jgi:hypothetical protein
MLRETSRETAQRTLTGELGKRTGSKPSTPKYGDYWAHFAPDPASGANTAPIERR